MSYTPNANFELLEYGVVGWSAIVNANLQKLDDYLGKFPALWNPTSIYDSSILVYDASSGKWVATTDYVKKSELSSITTDIVFTDSSKGVVLTDRANGKKYRLYVENGVLNLEEVT